MLRHVLTKVVGGVGFDINCGVRLIRTNLLEKDVAHLKEQIAQGLFEAIPVGVGSGGSVQCSKEELNKILVRKILRTQHRSFLICI